MATKKSGGDTTSKKVAVVRGMFVYGKKGAQYPIKK